MIPVKKLLNTPIHIIDIGSRNGPSHVPSNLQPYSEILLFEPDKDACNELEKSLNKQEFLSYQVCPTAVSAQPGLETLNLYRSAVNNSLLRRNEAFATRYKIDGLEIIGSEVIETDSLDNFKNSQQTRGSFCDLLNLDAQGADLPILRGASNTLESQTLAICVEVVFQQIYDEQPTFADIDMFLRTKGFTFYGFTEFSHRSTKRLDIKQQFTREILIHSDAIYFRDPFVNDLVLDLDQSIKLALLTAAYGFIDFSLEITDKLVSVPETQSMIKSYCDTISVAETKSSVCKTKEFIEKLQGNDNIFAETQRFVHQNIHLTNPQI